MSADNSEQSPNSVFLTAIALELGLGVLAVTLGWLLDVDVRQWIPRIEYDTYQSWQAWSPVVYGLGWGILAAAPMIVGIELLERIDWEPINSLKALDQLPLVSTMLTLSAAELIAISISAGVGEELLIRGWLMGWITGSLSTATPLAIASGLIASSVTFGLLHPITPAYAVVATVIGFYLGGLLLLTENLIAPIVAHAVYDAVQLLLAKRQHVRG